MMVQQWSYLKLRNETKLGKYLNQEVRKKDGELWNHNTQVLGLFATHLHIFTDQIGLTSSAMMSSAITGKQQQVKIKFDVVTI